MITDKRRFLRICLFILFALCLFATVAVAAQSAGVVVLHAVTEEQAETLGLHVFFTVVDGTGRPVADADIDQATIQVIGSESQPVAATVEKPNTPFYVVLLLDASGSMSDVIGAVREAAKLALEDAPPDAHFAVFKFNDLAVDGELRPVENFTTDRNLIAGGIDAVQAEAGGATCLYNALYQALGILEQQGDGPQARKAIILFTDGKDERQNGTVCSTRTYDDVVYRATRNTNARIPINTIGLCANEPCSNLDRPRLEGLAQDTVAFAAAGGQGNLNTMFQQIMDGLDSQWVAHTGLLVSAGTHEAVLQAGSRDGLFKSQTFTFRATRDFTQGAPPPNVQIDSVVYDPARDIYLLALNVTSPSLIGRIIVSVWDVRRGTQVISDLSFFNPGDEVITELKTDALEAGREYSVQIRAENLQGFLIEKPQEEDDRDPATTLLAESLVTYEPPVEPDPVPVEFTIEAVNADFEAKQLIIDLNILNAGSTAPVAQYRGFITGSTGGKVFEFGPQEYAGTRFVLPLPPVIQQAKGDEVYPVTVYLATSEGVESSALFEDFRPPRPGMIQRIQTYARDNPTSVLAGAAFLLSCVAVGFIYQNWRVRSKQPKLPPPPANPLTDVSLVGAGPRGLAAAKQSRPDPRQPQLRLRLTKAPDLREGEETERLIAEFPCVIGRDEELPPGEIALRSSKRFFSVGNDPRVSRLHLEITMQNGHFFLTDMQSQNGTFIGDSPLEPLKLRRLDGTTSVRLGRRTHLDVELV